MPADIGVVVPAYRPNVPVLKRYITELRDAVDPTSIVVALDDPRPGVLSKVRESDASVDVSPVRRGKGAAIMRGFNRLETDRLVFADADGSTPAASVADVVTALDNADVAVGSRRHPDATVETHQSHVRRRLGDAFAVVAHHVLPVDVADFQCGVKAMTASTWEELCDHVSEPGFGWDVEVLAVANAFDCTIAEVPIRWRDRPQSSVRPTRTAIELARVLVQSRLQTMALRGEVGTLKVDGGDRSTQVRSDGAGK